MDSKEATNVVINRISRLEPEPIAKMIIGFMHFQGFSDQEMIRLALGPDSLIHDLIEKAKNARLLVSSNVISPSLSDPSFHFGPFPTAFGRMDPFWDPQLPVEHPTVKNAPLKLIPYSDYTGLEDPLDYYCPEAAFSIRGARTSSSFMDHPVKTCYYFVKGFCKHGSNCRYSHGQSFPESYLRTFSPNSYDVAGENQVFSPGSLEKLELEIAGLLKSRRGNPVSIASLPMLYYEKYGKTLQAEGYLTESQRHGKAGYSLTKLLARLKNSIRLIDRPHGQHAVILAEDAAKYFDLRAERNDPGPVVNGSRQIYLTFPADSTFTEEDVSNYFSNFGAVQDVRIPCQQKRMFGFVSFVSADTVKLILSNGNPHYVCDSRVLVKPYREKAKLVERKYFESFGHPDFFQSHPADINSELETGGDSWQLSQRQLIEERELELEREMMRYAQLQLAGRAMDELRVPEGHPKFPSREHFNYMVDVLNSGSTSDDNPKYPGDHESSQGVNLPDSPFASAVGTSISAVI